MIVITDENVEHYDRSYWENAVPAPVQYKGCEMPFSHVASAFKEMRGVSNERVLDLAKDCHEHGLLLTSRIAAQLEKAEHNGDSDHFAENFIQCGYAGLPAEYSESAEEQVNTAFANDNRFHGRQPQIAPQIKAFVTDYGMGEHVASRFGIEEVRGLLQAGVSKADTVVMYMLLPKAQLPGLAARPELADMVAYELGKYMKNNRKGKDEKAVAHLRCARWMAAHPDTSLEMMEDVLDNALDIFGKNEEPTIGQVKAGLVKSEAYDEVRAVEKAYKKPGFKLSECVCELKQCEIKTGRYRAYIMDAKDPRQVMLGEATNCCQRLGDAGESSMMHGLLNPKAGFFVVEETSTGIIKAQAESWEYDENTLVFDNIEFANDAEISQYKEVIGQWLAASGYRNVAMGKGYNAMKYESHFADAPLMTPTITAREAYVMSYEDDMDVLDFHRRTAPNKREDDDICEIKSEAKAKELLDNGRIDYYDYLYCDTDDGKGLVWLKENDRVAEYFDVVQDLDILRLYASFMKEQFEQQEEEPEEEMVEERD